MSDKDKQDLLGAAEAKQAERDVKQKAREDAAVARANELAIKNAAREQAAASKAEARKLAAAEKEADKLAKAEAKASFVKEPCLCGCGLTPASKKARFLPGHDAKYHSALKGGPKKPASKAKRKAELADTIVAQIGDATDGDVVFNVTIAKEIAELLKPTAA